MAHYFYRRHTPSRVGPLRWAWRVEVVSSAGGDLIGVYSGQAWSRRGAVRATRAALADDNRERAPYGLRQANAQHEV